MIMARPLLFSKAIRSLSAGYLTLFEGPKMRRSVLAILFVTAVLMLPARAQADSLTFDLDFAFSGATPDSTGTYLTVAFLDGSDCLGGACAAGTVQLVLTASLEDSSEFVTEWDFNSSNLGVSVSYNAASPFNSGSYTA